MKRVGVIDYQICNINSVYSAFEHLDEDVHIVTAPDEVKKYSHLVLPGVGAFAEGMHNLVRNGMSQAVCEYANSGRPLLGICLGMQLLLSEGNEFERIKGLSIVDGKVCALDMLEGNQRVYPHTGWNIVDFCENSRLSSYVGNQEFYYFNHSYVCLPRDDSVKKGFVSLIEKHVAIIECDNVFGFQFHPEKSHSAGLKLLSGFMAQE
tara:strand:- start:630 stop:1250 length:621 start_codon:yes stop_codon:yes gene_type:complete